MTFARFLDLKPGDIVFYQNEFAEVKKVNTIKKGWISEGTCLKHSVFEVTLELCDGTYRYPKVYIDYPSQNSATLNNLSEDL